MDTLAGVRPLRLARRLVFARRGRRRPASQVAARTAVRSAAAVIFLPLRVATSTTRWTWRAVLVLVLLIPVLFIASGVDADADNRVVGGGADPVALGGSGGALGGTEPYQAAGVTSTMQALLDQVIPRFGRGHGIGCVGGRPGPSDHPSGRACDFMMSSPGNTHPTPEYRDHGWALAHWLAANAADLGVTYLIWQDRIWDISDPGWVDYTRYDNCTSRCVTLQHYDHVHVSVGS